MAAQNLAYLDPGSASIALQMLGGAIAATAVAVKLFWRRILRALHLGRPAPPAHASENDDHEPT